MALLLAFLHFSHSAFEVYSFLSFLMAAVVKASGCCRCKRRKRQTVGLWARLVEREYDVCWVRQAAQLHDEAVQGQWSKWAHIGNLLRNPRAGYHWTWGQWNVFSQRLRAHPWHQARQARLRQ